MQLLARSKDDSIVLSSASGGVFYELAKTVLEDRGIVIGAVWRDDLLVEHRAVDSLEDLPLLQGSKYLPSDMRNVYGAMRLALKAGRKVLFSGLPCQTAAIRKVFGDDLNLLICAVFCHSVPGLEIWKQYLKDIGRVLPAHIKKIRFRDKHSGWRNAEIVLEDSDGKELFRESVSSNAYMRAFIAGLSSRECCLQCKFKMEACRADVLIGDFWGVEHSCFGVDDDRGVNAVIVYSEKGLHLIERSKLLAEHVELEQIVKWNPAVEHAVRPDIRKRMKFLSRYKSVGVIQATGSVLDGRFPERVARKFKSAIKRFIAKNKKGDRNER